MNYLVQTRSLLVWFWTGSDGLGLVFAGLRNILPITTAKVPIVKFEHRQSGLEGDISLYNTLVQPSDILLE